MLRLCVAVPLVFFLCCVPASGAPYPLNEAAVMPPSGSSVVGGLDGLLSSPTFEFTASEGGLDNVTVEVASRNVQGQDGTLADDYMTGFGSLYRRDSAPSTFIGTASGPWILTPGTYFFQFSAIKWLRSAAAGTCPGGEPVWCDFASQVYTITVTATPTPTPTAPTRTPTYPAPTAAPSPAPVDALSPTQARAVVRSAIRQEARRPSHSLKYGCVRKTAAVTVCGASWYDRAYVWAVTVTAEARDGEHWYSGRGVRASRQCIKRATAKRCSRNVRW